MWTDIAIFLCGAVSGVAASWIWRAWMTRVEDRIQADLTTAYERTRAETQSAIQQAQQAAARGIEKL